MKIILAGPFTKDVLEELQKVLPEHDVLHIEKESEYQALTDAEIIILRVFKAPESIMRNNPALKSIIRWGAGYDSVDIEAAGKQGVYVSNIPGANAYAVSELAVALMLAVGRKLMEHHNKLRSGIWSREMFADNAVTLKGKLVCLVGGGAIGQQVAVKVRIFGATVQYYDIFRLSNTTEAKMNMTYVDLATLLKTSDIISLHIPLNDGTWHLID
jgi:Lactate dehydrogenase and related dehydrogenases